MAFITLTVNLPYAKPQPNSTLYQLLLKLAKGVPHSFIRTEIGVHNLFGMALLKIYTYNPILINNISSLVY